MIDMANESLLSIGDATKFLPGHPHVSTLWRWRMRGVRGIRLETILIGGRRFTSREAIERFVAAINTDFACGETLPRRTRKQRQLAIECAKRQLDEWGI